MEGPQAEFLCSQARYPAYFGGIGAGKTAGLMIAAMADFVTYAPHKKGMLSVFTVPVMSGTHMFFLPKWNELYREFYGSLWTWHEKLGVIRFPQWDASMFLRSAGEPEAMRGPELARVYMDEIASEAIGSQEELFRIAQGRIRQKGFGPNQIRVGSTPKVRWKWIVQRWQEHINPLTHLPLKNPEAYPMFHARTADNRHLDEDYKASLVAEWAGTPWGEQELEGKFIAVEGLALPMLDPNVHYIYPGEDTEFVKTVYGFDFGVTAPLAIVEWKQDRQGRKWATDEFYKRDADEYEWIEWLAQRNATRIICDPSVSDKQISYWATRWGIRMVRAKSKTFFDRVNVWATGLTYNLTGATPRHPTIYVTPRCPNTWNELLNLTYERPRGHEYNTDKWARGTPDHGFDAGAYGLMDFQKIDVKPLIVRDMRRVA